VKQFITNKLNRTIKIFSSPYELAEKFAVELINMINKTLLDRKVFTVALSGGSTPALLFSLLGDNFSKSVHWNNIHFFWGDERCVPPDSFDSNYGTVKRMLFDKIDILSSNIHRIRGEEDPEKEAFRYSMEISDYTVKKDGLPSFNLIILGLGEDGHIASIFPEHTELFYSDKICEVAVHPVTLKKRITITGRVINNADSVVFLVTGRNKSVVVENILKKHDPAHNIPASFVVPVNGSLSWFIDEDAGRLL
jgi:6-phosphogluconolactonase